VYHYNISFTYSKIACYIHTKHHFKTLRVTVKYKKGNIKKKKKKRKKKDEIKGMKLNITSHKFYAGLTDNILKKLGVAKERFCEFII
jgi:hypothetical protein